MHVTSSSADPSGAALHSLPDDGTAGQSVAAPAASGCHVLVVDDDPTVRWILVLALRREGFRVSSAADGESAWTALCSEPFDLLLTDQDMPRLNGLDLLRRVRAARLRLAVILTSGRMPRHEPDLPRLLAPDMMLDKPFTVPDLLATVRLALGRVAPGGGLWRDHGEVAAPAAPLSRYAAG